MKYYAGIGNRKISSKVFALLQTFGKIFAITGFILRTGGAEGADCAFETGALEGRGNVVVLTPDRATEDAMALAEKFHPAWDKCDDYAKRLLGRNVMIILGRDLTIPVSFVVCYAINENRGGTSLGLRIARAHNIPIANLAKMI